MTQSRGFWKRTSMLTIGGALGFWLANFAISLTPIAAEYRAALGIIYVPMLLQAMLGGLIIGFCVGYCLLRYYDRIPTTSPILKSGMLSFIALIVAIVFIEVPAFLTTTDDALRYFLIATAFNTVRILALGVVVGYLCGRLNGRARQ